MSKQTFFFHIVVEFRVTFCFFGDILIDPTKSFTICISLIDVFSIHFVWVIFVYIEMFQILEMKWKTVVLRINFRH